MTEEEEKALDRYWVEYSVSRKEYSVQCHSKKSTAAANAAAAFGTTK